MSTMPSACPRADAGNAPAAVGSGRPPRCSSSPSARETAAGLAQEVEGKSHCGMKAMKLYFTLSWRGDQRDLHRQCLRKQPPASSCSRSRAAASKNPLIRPELRPSPADVEDVRCRCVKSRKKSACFSSTTTPIAGAFQREIARIMPIFFFCRAGGGGRSTMQRSSGSLMDCASMADLSAYGSKYTPGSQADSSAPEALDLRHAAVAIGQLHRHRPGRRRELQIRRRIVRNHAGVVQDRRAASSAPCRAPRCRCRRAPRGSRSDTTSDACSRPAAPLNSRNDSQLVAVMSRILRWSRISAASGSKRIGNGPCISPLAST